MGGERSWGLISCLSPGPGGGAEGQGALPPVLLPAEVFPEGLLEARGTCWLRPANRVAPVPSQRGVTAPRGRQAAGAAGGTCVLPGPAGPAGPARPVGPGLAALGWPGVPQPLALAAAGPRCQPSAVRTAARLSPGSRGKPQAENC